MRQKLSSLVFNGPRAKTKTVLELACKMDPKSSIIQSVSDVWGILSLSSGDGGEGQHVDYVGPDIHQFWNFDTHPSFFLGENVFLK